MKSYRLIGILVTAALAMVFNLAILTRSDSRLGLNSYIFDESEYKIIKNLAEENSVLDIHSSGQFTTDAFDAYRYYFIQSEVLRDAALTGEDISSLISGDRHVWVIPGKQNAALYHNNNPEGKWEFGMSVNFTEGQRWKELADNAEVLDQTNELLLRGEQLLLGPVYIRAAKYETLFAYLKTNKDQYLIPYSTVIRFTGLENGRLYTARECITALEENYPIPEGSPEDYDPENMGDSRVMIEEREAQTFLIEKQGVQFSKKVGLSHGMVLILVFGNIVLLGLLVPLLLLKRGKKAAS